MSTFVTPAPRTITWRNRILAAAGIALLLVGTMATSVSAAPRPISFEVFIGDFCVAGQAKNNSFLKVIISDHNGRQKGREAVEADPQGFWFSCTFGQTIVPGDTIKVTVFGTGQTRTLTVPLITGRVDRGTNTVSGKAPAGTDVEIEAFDFRWDFWGESYDAIHDVTATGGNYSYDFDNDGIDIKGGSRVVITWRNGSDTVKVGRFQFAPFLTFALGSSEVAGASRSNGAIKITLSDPPSNRVAAASGVGNYGDTTFYATFAGTDGEPYEVQGGEMLKAPALGAQSTWRIPEIDGSTDLAADEVSGKCFDNGRFAVLVQNPGGFEFGLDFGDADGNGDFTIDLSAQINIKRGYSAAILCYSPEGDEIVQEFVAR